MVIPGWLVCVALAVPPVVLIGVMGMTLVVVMSLRRSRGAHRLIPQEGFMVMGAALVVHAGYFAAPVLAAYGRMGLGLILVAPVALAVTGYAIAWCSRNPIRNGAGRVPQPMGMIIVAAAVAYWMPVALLAAGMAGAVQKMS